MAAAILITGANRGLGFEFASQYLAEGWRVFATCRNFAKGRICKAAFSPPETGSRHHHMGKHAGWLASFAGPAAA
jgi:NAD(P)-dependent dehydrogenase (short-subunit alcohol dehydrogenase family)